MPLSELFLLVWLFVGLPTMVWWSGRRYRRERAEMLAEVRSRRQLVPIEMTTCPNCGHFFGELTNGG